VDRWGLENYESYAAFKAITRKHWPRLEVLKGNTFPLGNTGIYLSIKDYSGVHPE